MKAEIEIACNEPELIVKSVKPDQEELNKFDVKLVSEKNKIKLIRIWYERWNYE